MGLGDSRVDVLGWAIPGMVPQGRDTSNGAYAATTEIDPKGAHFVPSPDLGPKPHRVSCSASLAARLTYLKEVSW